MASYDLSAIKAALTAASKGGGTQNTQQKNVYWSPTMGEHELRFLPLQTPTAEPFLTVGFYNEPLVQKRIVAPSTFGLPDFVKEQYEELRNSKKHPDGWAVAKHLRAKDRYFAAVIVRGEEVKGPQIWEFSKEVRDQIYGILTHKDNVDEDMLSPKLGYDFTCTVAPVIEGGKPRMFKNSPVKGITLQPRKKPTPLHKDQATADKWLATAPDIAGFYQRMCKSQEEMIEILENFVASLTNTAPKEKDGTDYNAGKATGQTVATAAPAEEKLNSAFEGLLSD